MQEQSVSTNQNKVSAASSTALGSLLDCLNCAPRWRRRDGWKIRWLVGSRGLVRNGRGRGAASGARDKAPRVDALGQRVPRADRHVFEAREVCVGSAEVCPRDAANVTRGGAHHAVNVHAGRETGRTARRRRRNERRWEGKVAQPAGVLGEKGRARRHCDTVATATHSELVRRADCAEAAIPS